ncbi:MAG: hypothetical protein LBK99_02555 [Opitutaceae bacterium]|jgi:hypothetical protein|nr:hypothetical protein [Opitutaceae bacterium]
MSKENVRPVVRGKLVADDNPLPVSAVSGGAPVSADNPLPVIVVSGRVRAGRAGIPAGVEALAVTFAPPFAAGALPVVTLALETPAGGANLIGHIESLTNTGFTAVLTDGGGEGYFLHYTARVPS